MPVNFKISNHIILPFGSPKWDISKISVSAISPSGTYFTSQTKCAYIDVAKKEALRLYQFIDFLPNDPKSYPKIEESGNALIFMCEYLKNNCELQTESEKLFLDIYFKHIFYWLGNAKDLKVTPHWAFWSLMPFPQAHIYCKDPFSEEMGWYGYDYQPDRMKRVDFVFWTGHQLVAIEIDGGSHIGNPDHIEKDRLLQRAGVHVIHILNDELVRHNVKVIEALLPTEIAEPWPFHPIFDEMGKPPTYCSNPLRY